MTSRSTSRASCELTENYALQVQGKGMPAAPSCYRLQRCLVICTELQHRTALSLSRQICIDSLARHLIVSHEPRDAVRRDLDEVTAARMSRDLLARRIDEPSPQRLATVCNEMPRKTTDICVTRLAIGEHGAVGNVEFGEERRGAVALVVVTPSTYPIALRTLTWP